jgi:hypothetical protein
MAINFLLHLKHCVPTLCRRAHVYVD